MAGFDLEIDYRPVMPRRRDHPIAIVGAGGIVQDAHLPAYRKAGFPVAGLFDLDQDKARRVAAQHGVPRVYRSLDELLDDRSVEIVDVAVYPDRQLAIVEQVAAAGRHLLCQKPLAIDYARAVRTVEAARRAGVKLAVNQQMRWDAGIRYARQLIERGLLGTLSYGVIQVHVLTPWHLWPWIYQGERIEILFHSIHYVDSLRYLLGDPVRVYTSGARSPGETTRGETKTITVLEYEGVLQGLIDVNHGVWQNAPEARFRFEGSDGLVQGTIGLLAEYPHGRPDTLEFFARSVSPTTWFRPTLEDRWIPDAFVGPMASLMRAIEDGGEPETSGADNLKTLQCVFAAYRSIQEKRAVAPAEVTP